MSRSVGKVAEDVVAEYLLERGYAVIDKNVTFPFGELDVIAQIDKTVVFIEVKYRRSLADGFHLESVNRSKQRKIIMAAKAYLQREFRSSLPRCRFDVIAVWGDLKRPGMDHIEDAFWDDGAY